MTLYHPLNTQSNKQAIEKYKDRLVYVYNPQYELYLCSEDKIVWGCIRERVSLTFKDALKRTKHYHQRLEYRFVSEIGESKTPISEFTDEDVYSCTSVRFEPNKYISYVS